MKTFLAFIFRHREWLLLPLFIGLMMGSLRLYWFLTGRVPLEDPTEIVALAYRAITLAVAVAFVGFIKSHERFNIPCGRDGMDRVVLSRVWTLALLVFVWYALTH